MSFRAAKSQLEPSTMRNVLTVVTDLSEEDYQEYYNGFANHGLWPVLHYRIDLTEFNRRDLTGYLRVNQHFTTTRRSCNPTTSFGFTTII